MNEEFRCQIDFLHFAVPVHPADGPATSVRGGTFHGNKALFVVVRVSVNWLDLQGAAPIGKCFQILHLEITASCSCVIIRHKFFDGLGSATTPVEPIGSFQEL